MNNIYKQKYEKYKYKYLKLKGELEGGVRLCSEEDLNDSLDKGKLSEYTERCTLDKMKKMNDDEEKERKNAIQINKSKFDHDVHIFNNEQKALLQENYEKYLRDEIDKSELDRIIDEQNRTRGICKSIR